MDTTGECSAPAECVAHDQANSTAAIGGQEILTIVCCFSLVFNVIQFWLHRKDTRSFSSSSRSPKTNSSQPVQEPVQPTNEQVACNQHPGQFICWGLVPFPVVAPNLNGSVFDIPVDVANSNVKLGSVKSLSCGGRHALLLTHHGHVYEAGEVYSSKTNAIVRREPFLMVSFSQQRALHNTRVRYVCCGATFSVAVAQDGTVFTWGDGRNGQLGHGSTNNSEPHPKKVAGLLGSHVVSVACGSTHSLAVTANGSVYSWGCGCAGQLGVGTFKDQSSPVQIPDFGSRSNGVKAIQRSSEATTSIEPRGIIIVFVNCGPDFSLAIDSNHNVMMWGRGTEGQCGTPNLRNRCKPTLLHTLCGLQVVEASCGRNFTVARTEDGYLYSWGNGEFNQLGTGALAQHLPEQVILPQEDNTESDTTLVVRVCCGDHHVVAVTKTGKLLCWGFNVHGEAGPIGSSSAAEPQFVPNITVNGLYQLACGSAFSALLTYEQCVVVQDEITQPILPHKHVTSSQTKTIAEPQQFPPSPHLSKSVGTKSQRSAESKKLQKAEKRRQVEHAQNVKVWKHRILPKLKSGCLDTEVLSHWEQGIPQELRRYAWPIVLGNRLRITPMLYEIFRERAQHLVSVENKDDANPMEQNNLFMSIGKELSLDLIDGDLPRTFPTFQLFSHDGPLYANLKAVLEAHSCYRPDVGYIQGMSYLAANLCVHLQDEFVTFQCLANLLTKGHMYSFCVLEHGIIEQYYKLFLDAVCEQQKLEVVGRHLENLGVRPEYFLFNWLQTLFLKVLPLEIASRVWDNYILHGTPYAFKCSLAILTLFSERLLRSPFEECIRLLSFSPGVESEWAELVTETNLFYAIQKIKIGPRISTDIEALDQQTHFYSQTSSNKSPRVRNDSSAFSSISSASGMSSP